MRQRLEIYLFQLAVRALRFLMAGHLPGMVVSSGLIEEEGRILFVRRRDGRGLNFPGGYLTWGEDPIDGALREVREETGYDAEPDGDPLIGVYGSRSPGRTGGSPIVLYRLRRSGGKVRSSHEGDPVWLTPEDAFNERLAHGTEFILKDYLRRVKREE